MTNLHSPRYQTLWLLLYFVRPYATYDKCFFFSLCFGLIGHLQVYNLVYRTFRATITGADSSLDWYCAAMHLSLSFFEEEGGAAQEGQERYNRIAFYIPRELV
jgi:hypothetical protein